MKTLRSRIYLAIGIAGVAGALLIASLGSGYATRFFFDQTAQRAESTLRLTVAALSGALSRFGPLPELIADSPDVRALLERSSQTGLVSQLNGQLKKINDVVEASDIYIMKPDGLTIAASNFDTDKSFIGKNFSYRPYYTDAIAGGQGRYFALGTTSLKRGYYFAAPVRHVDTVLGVVAVKMDVDEIETAWRSAEHEIIVVDEYGIIFMSGRPEWRFKAIRPLSPAILERIEATRRYPTSSLLELPFAYLEGSGGGHLLASVDQEGTHTEYLVKSAAMPAAGWTVHVLAKTAPARTQAYVSLAVGLLLLLTLILTGTFFIQRRQSLMDRIAAQQAAQNQLERRVDERTADLNRANEKLVAEVAERKSAEEELRQAQADLIQASKLAALGQMSAALSHEFNQPLGAAKSYADNAASYIDRGRIGEARDNITRISTLVDRMAAIGKHLRNFARKPDDKLAAVPVGQVINDAVEIVAGHVRDRSAQITIEPGEEPLYALGGMNRLQQVLVNLLSNALDAMETAAEPRIEISAMSAGAGRILIKVRDHGEGIDEAATGKIFDPFFTTKGVGKGLGLGLSISYNIVKDFGGRLTVESHPEGGAVFIVDLERAREVPEAAAE